MEIKQQSIEFRVWNGYNLQFENCECFISKTGSIYYFDKGLMQLVPLEKYHIAQQFTDLTDKNGKKIFEGDILHIQGNIRGNCIQEVCFQNGCFGINVTPTNAIRLGLGENFHPFGFVGVEINPNNQRLYWEVIGNIFENPKLLK